MPQPKYSPKRANPLYTPPAIAEPRSGTPDPPSAARWHGAYRSCFGHRQTAATDARAPAQTSGPPPARRQRGKLTTRLGAENSESDQSSAGVCSPAETADPLA